MKPSEPDPVKLFLGILYCNADLLKKAVELLHEKFGRIDYQSEPFPFSVTDYYVSEMGSPISRIFVSFQTLIHPKELSRIKIETNEMEDHLSSDRKRNVNLDPGYMDYDKVVLASAKYNGQKIYLDAGIWADLTLHYEKGKYKSYAWSFPDFKSGMYNDVFMEIRQIYKAKRKNNHSTKG